MNLYALRDFYNMILDMNLNILLGYVLAIYFVLCWLFVKFTTSSPSYSRSYSNQDHRESRNDPDFNRRQDLERKSAILRNRNDKGGGWF